MNEKTEGKSWTKQCEYSGGMKCHWISCPFDDDHFISALERTVYATTVKALPIERSTQSHPTKCYNSSIISHIDNSLLFREDPEVLADHFRGNKINYRTCRSFRSAWHQWRRNKQPTYQYSIQDVDNGAGRRSP